MVLLPIGFASDHVIKPSIAIEPRWVIVAFAPALIERVAGRQLDVPALGEHRISGEIDVDRAKQ